MHATVLRSFFDELDKIAQTGADLGIPGAAKASDMPGALGAKDMPGASSPTATAAAAPPAPPPPPPPAAPTGGMGLDPKASAAGRNEASTKALQNLSSQLGGGSGGTTSPVGSATPSWAQ